MSKNEAIRTLDKMLDKLEKHRIEAYQFNEWRDEIEAIRLAIKALVVYPEKKENSK